MKNNKSAVAKKKESTKTPTTKKTKKDGGKQVSTIKYNDAAEETLCPERLVEALGVEDCGLQAHYLEQILSAFGGFSEEEFSKTLDLALALLQEIKPRNGMETLLATQMIHTHNLSIAMMRRATVPQQTVDGVDRNVNRATKLMRVFNSQLDALQKLRGKGQQKIIVEHVNVNEGGQAIVGDVSYQGGGK
jgi:hypothetical protein